MMTKDRTTAYLMMLRSCETRWLILYGPPGMSVLTADDSPFVSDDELNVISSAPSRQLGIQCPATIGSVGIVTYNGVHTSAPSSGSGAISCDNVTALFTVQSAGTEMIQYGETASVPAGENELLYYVLLAGSVT